MINSKDFVESLDKGLAIIEAFDTADSRLTLSEVAARVGITRAAARRFLLTLSELGYARVDDRHFSLTPKVLVLSRSQLGGNATFQAVQALLNQLAAKTAESVSAAVMSGPDIVVVARATSPRPVSVHIAIGTRMPAFCTAMGRVLLGEMEEAAVQQLLKLSPPRKLSELTRVDSREIVMETRRSHARGYATSIGELDVGLNTLAVPVRTPQGADRLSIGLSVPAYRMSEQELVDTFLPELQATAARLANLG
ncbi:helix-turn-helix domain-containing protein [Ramlibacter sp. AW1]|uniref:Helix-turn-helix domain-containing protein n=1 Tax=Ramlibacter aurantiacus TaxID=2801330 RepID=A0A936ZFP8_9BURK|nr:IclR family transcriptional regulator C-terminal domain-containing protein [Ramlibacter aurantiacus]MBL0419042.1 helix-turn-helix domain-containing protein [Ramlibacter aurantiacus]